MMIIQVYIYKKIDYSSIYNERSQNGLIVRWVDKCIESNSKAITITSLHTRKSLK